jgi:uncharacterized protein with HEPN domain
MRDERTTTRMTLERMRLTIARVREHVQGMDRDDFFADKRTADAALMQLYVLGEEVHRLPPQVLDKYAYPWHLVRAQRNVIAHDYFGIRLPSIWATIQNDLGPLDQMLQRILESEFK